MGDSHKHKSDRPTDDWSHKVGHWTFVWTAVLAALYVGTVFVYVMR